MSAPASEERPGERAHPCPICEAARRKRPSEDVVWGVYTIEGLARHLQAANGREDR